MSGVHHHLVVSHQQVGALFRAVRIRNRKRQADVAVAAGVPRSLVSSVERGHLGDVPIGQLQAIAWQLEIRVELVATWRGGDGARIVNARHSRMHELVAARLAARSGWEFATEVTFSEWGERGVVDVLAWHGATRTLLVIELKTEIPDPAGLVAQVDRYRRLARKIGRARGWDPLHVATWVLVAESDFNRRQHARHKLMLSNAFPLDGQFMRRWLRDPSASPASRAGGPAGGPGAAPSAPSGDRVPGGVSGLSFLANVAVGVTGGRLGPTKRVGRQRPSLDTPHSLGSDARATHGRRNPAVAGSRSAVGAPHVGEDLG
jgi:transcriptional regulator with XRE-family HTH domain